MLSTRLFLKTLENFGRVKSADAIIREIAEKGRSVARYAVDRPGKVDLKTRSQWTDALQQDETKKPPHD
jgi:hypothetical protein